MDTQTATPTFLASEDERETNNIAWTIKLANIYYNIEEGKGVSRRTKSH